ncbi:MAG: hypothetical protein K9W46_05465 [Candidatus Heimdallarchaeum endolithica]|uniref:Uncharacterized protein n=1 Tax=Candidatus Heimdallarchaeum endolithica TaxID=2876572 RepID=A0A9Y1BSU8_9ARCH|nr:MAG: hypothetical protein K9W46_05465 [Candidatus Heimdallarchaeum endolithica]
MRIKKILTLFLILIVFTVSNFNPKLTKASFYLGSIEKEDDWFIESKKVDFNDSFKANINFAFGNTSLGFATYLSFNSEINAPLNITGYLNRKIKKDSSTIGLNVKGDKGNIIIGLNGTVLVAINDTILPFEFNQDLQNSYTNFSSLFGENISIPINVNPITFEIPTEDFLPNFLITEIKVKVQPVLLFTGSISLSLEVINETLTWNTGEEIYFTDVQISKDQTDYSIYLKNINYNFSNTTIKITAIKSTVTFSSDTFGDLYSTEFEIELDTINNSSNDQLVNDLAVFLLDNLVELEDETLTISIADTPFNLSSVFIAIIVMLITTRKIKLKKSKT